MVDGHYGYTSRDSGDLSSRTIPAPDHSGLFLFQFFPFKSQKTHTISIA